MQPVLRLLGMAIAFPCQAGIPETKANVNFCLVFAMFSGRCRGHWIRSGVGLLCRFHSFISGISMSTSNNLVLLPGLLCTRALWAPQIEAFSGSSNVHVPDLGQHDTIAGMAAHVLAEAPDSFALAGLSMGGYVAFEVFRQAPDRVERIAFLDTSARPDDPTKQVQRQDLINLAKRGSFKGVSPRLIPLLIQPERADDMVLTGTISAMALDIGPDGFIRQQQAISGRADSRPTLAEIKCPALVVVGEDDILTPPELAEEIAAGISGSTLEYIPGAAHLPTLEEPHATNEVLKNWLRQKK